MILKIVVFTLVIGESSLKSRITIKTEMSQCLINNMIYVEVVNVKQFPFS